jgi:hypothetical protein
MLLLLLWTAAATTIILLFLNQSLMVIIHDNYNNSLWIEPEMQMIDTVVAAVVLNRAGVTNNMLGDFVS